MKLTTHGWELQDPLSMGLSLAECYSWITTVNGKKRELLTLGKTVLVIQAVRASG